MSKLSKKPVSQPRPLRTRDHILSVLDRQALPISRHELEKQLRKLGPQPHLPDLTKNLNELIRLGHIKLVHDDNTGAHYVRVPDNVVPHHRPRDQTTQLRTWALDTLKHGPATAATLSEGAKRAGLIDTGKSPNDAARHVGTCLQLLVKNGELETSPCRTVTSTVKQYRLPGAAPAVDITLVPRKSSTPQEPISDLQRGILEWLSANAPATAAEMTPILISAGILKPGNQASGTVGSAARGLEQRGQVIKAGHQKHANGTKTTIWGLPGQSVTAPAPKADKPPDLSALDRISEALDDIAEAFCPPCGQHAERLRISEALDDITEALAQLRKVLRRAA